MITDAVLAAAWDGRRAGLEVTTICVAPRTFLDIRKENQDTWALAPPDARAMLGGVFLQAIRTVPEDEAHFLDARGVLVGTARVRAPPSPYDLIADVRADPEGRWVALDERGAFLMELSEAGARKVLAKLR